MANELVTTKHKLDRVGAMLEKLKPQMAKVLPRGAHIDRLTRLALSTMVRVPKLLECSPQSFLSSVLQAAALGLEFDQTLGEAYLVPFKGVVQLIPGYRGLCKLARQSGEVSSIHARVVRKGDVFEYSYGLEKDILVHKPAGGPPLKAADCVGAYCVMRLRDGGTLFEFLPVEEIEAIRKRSRAAEDGPWITDWAEMAKKTAVRRVSKLAPLSSEKGAQFSRAAALDDQAENNLDQTFDGEILDVTAELGLEEEDAKPPRNVADLVKDAKPKAERESGGEG